MESRRVEFRSDGVQLVGDLYLPAGDGPRQAVVVTAALSNVNEQVPATYAEQFARRGVAAVGFDHRNWGASAEPPSTPPAVPGSWGGWNPPTASTSTTGNPL